MPHTIALVIDPLFELAYKDATYRSMFQAEMNKLPITDLFLTATSRPIHKIIGSECNNPNSKHGFKQQGHRAKVRNNVIMSFRHEATRYNSKTKSWVTTPTPNRFLIQTNLGLANTNAEHDALQRMFDKNHKIINLVVLVDPNCHISGQTPLVQNLPPMASITLQRGQSLAGGYYLPTVVI